MSTIPLSPKQKPDESTLTDRQRKVLDAIRTHIDEQGFAPSFREIGNAAGLKSPSSVKHQLQVLEDKGFIRMNANKGRAIEVVAGSAPNAEKPSQASEEATSTSNVAEIYQFPAEAIAESHDVPLVGRIAAGVPITAEQHVDDVMRLPERLTGSGTLFMLEVHGDSMVDAGIDEDDLLVIERNCPALEGDIVVALDEDNQNTLKRYAGYDKDSGYYILEYENEARYPGKTIKVRSFQVQGVARHVIKSL